MTNAYDKDLNINMMDQDERCFKPITLKGLWTGFLSLFQ